MRDNDARHHRTSATGPGQNRYSRAGGRTELGSVSITGHCRRNKAAPVFGRRRARSERFRARTDQTACPRICLRSCSGVVIGAIWNVSTSTFKTLGVIKAGRVGPSRMFFTPK